MMNGECRMPALPLVFCFCLLIHHSPFPIHPVIRILIREVTDSRHRAPKSLGLADIEPAAELPLYPGERPRDYSVRIYHGSPHDRQVRFQTRVARAGSARPDWWAVLRDALNQVLPPAAKRK
jgi:hypothetical protein